MAKWSTSTALKAINNARADIAKRKEEDGENFTYEPWAVPDEETQANQAEEINRRYAELQQNGASDAILAARQSVADSNAAYKNMVEENQRQREQEQTMLQNALTVGSLDSYKAYKNASADQQTALANIYTAQNQTLTGYDRFAGNKAGTYSATKLADQFKSDYGVSDADYNTLMDGYNTYRQAKSKQASDTYTSLTDSQKTLLDEISESQSSKQGSAVYRAQSKINQLKQETGVDDDTVNNWQSLRNDEKNTRVSASKASQISSDEINKLDRNARAAIDDYMKGYQQSQTAAGTGSLFENIKGQLTNPLKQSKAISEGGQLMESARQRLKELGYSDSDIKKYEEYAQVYAEDNLMEKDKSNAQKNPLSSNVNAILTDATLGMANGITQFTNDTIENATGKNTNSSPNNFGVGHGVGARASRYASNVQEGTQRAINNGDDENSTLVQKVGKELYNMGYSAAQSNLTNIVGALGSAALGSNIAGELASLVPAFGNTYYQSKMNAEERGLSNDKAYQTAFAEARHEVETETLSDRVLGLMFKEDTVKNILKETLKGAAEEGGEEVTNNILNAITDRVINGDKSELNQTVQNYMAQGATQQEAIIQTATDFIKDSAYDFLTAAGSTIIGMAPNAAARTIDNRVTGNSLFGSNTAQDYRDLQESYDLDESKASYPQVKKAYDLAGKYAEKLENGGKVTTSERAKLWDTTNGIAGIEQTAAGNAERDEKRTKLKNDIKDGFKGIFNRSENTTQTETTTAEQTPTTENQTETTGSAQGSVSGTENYVPAETHTTYNDAYKAIQSATTQEELNDAVQDAKASTEISEEDYARLRETAGSYAASKNNLNMEAAEVSTEDAYNEGYQNPNAENPYTGISSKNAIAFNEAQQRSKEDREAQVAQNKKYVAEASKQQVDEKSQLFIQNNYTEEMNPRTYARVMNAAITAGRTNMSYEDFEKEVGTSLGELGENASNLVGRAYTSGIESRVQEIAIEANRSKAARESVTKWGKGQVIDERTNSSDTRVSNLAGLVSAITGYDVRIQNLGAGSNISGYTRSRVGEITLNADDIESLVQAGFHEPMEVASVWAPNETNDFVDCVMQALTKQYGTAFTNAYNMAAVTSWGSKTNRDVYKEIANNQIFHLLGTEEGVNDLMNAIDEKFGRKKATTIKEKFLKWLSGVVDSIKSLLKVAEFDPYQKKIVEGGLKNAEDLRQKAIDLLATSAKNYYDASMATQQNTTENNEKADTVDDVRKTVKFANVNTDSAGNALTREQQDWAAESVVRDSDGKLKVMYHGTQTGGFTVFDVGKSKGSNLYGRGIYFSDSKFMAGDYGDTYEVYLNVKNPIQPGNKTITKDQLRKLVNEIAENEDYGIENYGYGATVDSVVKSVWGKDDFQVLQDLNATCVGDFVETVKMFNELNGTDYDGIIDDTQAIVWHPYQIKAITNQTPTDSDDIRKMVRMAKDVDKLSDNGESEKTRDLIAVHNLTLEELVADITMGGFPSPSVAIIKSSMKHTRYGDVSVVLNRESVDPEFIRKNKIYSGDAWTPTFPSIEYDINDDVYYSAQNKLEKIMDGKSPDYLIFRMKRFNSLQRGGDSVVRGGMPRFIESAKNDYGLKAAYLNSQGITIKDNAKKMQVSNLPKDQVDKYEAMRPALSEIAEAFEADRSTLNSRDIVDKYFSQIQKAYKDYAKILPDESAKKYLDLISDIDKRPYKRKLIEFNVHEAILYYGEENHTHEEIVRDEAAINSEIDKQLDEKQFEGWLEKTYKGLVKGKGIRNEKEMFTASGNRRSFKQLHYDVTLENIVKAMNEQDAKGADAFGQDAALFAVATKEFGSIEEVHKFEDMLTSVPEEEYTAIRDKYYARIAEIAQKLSKPQYGVAKAKEAMLDAVQHRKTATGIENVLREYSTVNVYKGAGRDVLNLIQDMSNMPTQYFEAKPQRAVHLDEIAMVVVPNNITDFQQETLQSAGIPFTLYEAGNEDARHEAIEALEDVRFDKKIANIEPAKNVLDHDYSYDTLIKKDDIRVESYVTYGLKSGNGLTTREDLRKLAGDNIQRFNEERGGGSVRDSIFNDDLGKRVIFNRASYDHALRRIKSLNSELMANVPVFMSNAIVVNEADGNRKNAGYAYIMDGVYQDSIDQSSIHVVEIAINHYNNSLVANLRNDVVYSFAQKKEDAALSAEQRLSDNGTLSQTSSVISVAKLLEIASKAYPNELSLDVAQQLGYVRGNSRFEDLRYDIGIDEFDFEQFGDPLLNDLTEDELREWVTTGGEQETETKGTTDLVSALRSSNEVLKGGKVNKADIRKIARQIKSQYGSNINVDTLAENLAKIFDYAQSRDYINYEDLATVIAEVAAPVIDGSVNKVGAEEFDSFKNTLKGYTFKLNERQENEVIRAFGSWGAFRKQLPGVKFVRGDSDGVALDSVWDSLCKESGYVLDSMVTSNDMPLVLVDAYNSMRPTYQNAFGEDAERATQDAAMEIVSKYYQYAADQEKSELKKQQRQRLIDQSNMLKKQNEETRKKLQQQYKERLENEVAKLKQEGKSEKVSVQVARLRARNARTVASLRESQKRKEQLRTLNKNAAKLVEWVSNPTDKNHIPKMMQTPVLELVSAMDFVPQTVRETADGKYSIRLLESRHVNEDGSYSYTWKTITADTVQEAIEAYKKAMNDFGLGSASNRTWQERMQTIQDLYQQNEEDEWFEKSELKQGLDKNLGEQLGDILKNNRGMLSIAELSSDELQTINDVVRNVMHAVNQMNRMYSQPSQKVTDVAHEVMDRAYQQKAKGRRAHGDTMNDLLDLLTLDNATSETFFHGLFGGDETDPITKTMLKAQNQKARDIRQAQEYMSEYMTKDIKDVVKDWMYSKTGDHNTRNFYGMELTTTQVMSLYELMKRPDAQQHKIGGFMVDETGRKTDGRHKVVHLTDEQITSITDTLSEEQKRIADAMQYYMAHQCAEQGNETAMQLYGYEKYLDEHYFPMATDKNTIATKDSNVTTGAVNAIKNSDFTKKITPNANNPLILKDIFTVFSDHVSDMATYHSWAAPLQDILRFYNYNEKTNVDKGGQTFVERRSTKDAFDYFYGKSGQQYMTKLLSSINQMEKSNLVGGKFMERMTGNAKTAAVMGNIRVVVQQPTAFFRAGEMISYKYLNDGLTGKYVKEAAELRDRTSDVFWLKNQGNIDGYITQGMVSTITGVQTFKERINEWAGKLASKADEITWAAMYRAVYSEQVDKLGKNKVGTEEFENAVNDRFSEIMLRTQVYDGTITRSQFMRSTDWYNKIASAFMAEPTKTYNILLRHLIDLSQADSKTAVATAKKGIVKAAYVLTLTNFANAVAQSLMDAVRNAGDADDDDKNFWERFLEAFGFEALVDDEDDTLLTAAEKFMSGNFMDNMDMLSNIPLVADTWDAVKSGFKSLSGGSTYSSDSDLSMSGINNFFKAAKAIINPSEKMTTYGRFAAVARGFSDMTGIPLYAVQRDVVATYNTIAKDIMNLPVLQKTSKYTKAQQAKQDVYEGVITDVYENAVNSGDYKEAIENAVEQGSSYKSIKQSLKSNTQDIYVRLLKTDPSEATKMKNRLAQMYSYLDEKTDVRTDKSEAEKLEYHKGEIDKWKADWEEKQAEEQK